MRNFRIFAASLMALFLVFGGGCAVEEETPVVDNGAGGASGDEAIDETAQAVTVTCGTTFDCRSYPPPPRTDGRSWIFWGSRYCNTSLSGTGFITCQWVPSGLSSNFPTKLTHAVPTSCLACTSNNAKTSTCYNNLYDISSWSWTCNLPTPARGATRARGEGC